jgi:hypothetical protein
MDRRRAMGPPLLVPLNGELLELVMLSKSRRG